MELGIITLALIFIFSISFKKFFVSRDKRHLNSSYRTASSGFIFYLLPLGMQLLQLVTFGSVSKKICICLSTTCHLIELNT